MAKDDLGMFGEGQQSTVSVREWLTRYLANWPLFLICILICVGVGIIYIRNTVPKYIASTNYLIRGSDRGNSNSDDLIESALNGKSSVNLNNEMRLIKAGNLMVRTVAKMGFNTSYFIKGRILNIEVYKEAPFTLVAKQLTDSNRTYSFHIKKIHMLGGAFLYGPEQAETLYPFRWNEPFTVDGQVFLLAPKRRMANEDGEYIVRWQPIGVTASALSENLSAYPLDTKSSIMQISLKTENLQKGTDILNALFTEFNLSDMEDRNKLFESTVQFIDERLLVISGELRGVEGNLENFQGSKQLIDIKSQTAQSLGNTNDVSRTIKDLGVEQGVTNMIQEYFANPANSNKLVPSSFGLSDATLASLITQYNEAQLKKEREAPMVAPNSTVMQDLNLQLASLKGSILESLNNITKNLRLRENSFRQQNSQFKSFLSSIPHSERVMQEIKRKQSITEGLYLYLLQKREETAISSTGSNVPHYKQIDLASGYGPVEPDKRNIILYASLLGLCLAAGWIYVRDNLLNDKITTRADITKKTALPLIGQISHIPKKRKEVIQVLGRNIAGEEFRAIRTKLAFILKNKTEKVILITSSISNEGKSFISLNLAAVCAVPGKKVALLEFDIRNPTIASHLRLDSFKGLTDYLSGEARSLSEIYFATKEIPTLHIYPAGPFSSNPADILLSENIGKLFQNLKKDYDFIFVDSPPVSLVSDAFMLDPYSQIVLYVLREGITLKKHLEFINDISAGSNLGNINLIFNDVKTEDNPGYYAYGEGYGYAKTKNEKGIRKSFAKILNFLNL